MNLIYDTIEYPLCEINGGRNEFSDVILVDHSYETHIRLVSSIKLWLKRGNINDILITGDEMKEILLF